MTHLSSIQNVSHCTGYFETESVFGHPEDIVSDPAMTSQEKRALLASWASDANAVPHVPSLRQLPDGSTVKLEDILRALKSLDEAGGPPPSDGRRDTRRQRIIQGRRGQWLWWRTGRGRRDDDDDDPPPCPAAIAPHPGCSGGGPVAPPTPVAA